MATKRFCDLCGAEIPIFTSYYDLVIEEQSTSSYCDNRTSDDMCEHCKRSLDDWKKGRKVKPVTGVR